MLSMNYEHLGDASYFQKLGAGQQLCTQPNKMEDGVTEHDLYLIEQPTLTAACGCGCTVKRSTTQTGQLISLEFPYIIRAITRDDGHSYESVSDYFEHRCPLTFAASRTNQTAAA